MKLYCLSKVGILGFKAFDYHKVIYKIFLDNFPSILSYFI